MSICRCLWLHHLADLMIPSSLWICHFANARIYYNLDSIEKAPDQDQVVVQAGLRIIIENQSAFTAEDASHLLHTAKLIWSPITGAAKGIINQIDFLLPMQPAGRLSIARSYPR